MERIFDLTAGYRPEVGDRFRVGPWVGTCTKVHANPNGHTYVHMDVDIFPENTSHWDDWALTAEP